MASAQTHKGKRKRSARQPSSSPREETPAAVRVIVHDENGLRTVAEYGSDRRLLRSARTQPTLRARP
jgi:hypothetical protein